MTTPDRSRADKIAFVLYLILFHGSWTTWVVFGYPHLRALGEHTLLYASINVLVRALLWVLPNTSGLNAHYQAAGFARAFAELRAAVAGRPRR